MAPHQGQVALVAPTGRRLEVLARRTALHQVASLVPDQHTEVQALASLVAPDQLTEARALASPVVQDRLTVHHRQALRALLDRVRLMARHQAVLPRAVVVNVLALLLVRPQLLPALNHLPHRPEEPTVVALQLEAHPSLLRTARAALPAFQAPPPLLTQ